MKYFLPDCDPRCEQAQQTTQSLGPRQKTFFSFNELFLIAYKELQISVVISSPTWAIGPDISFRGEYIDVWLT